MPVAVFLLLAISLSVKADSEQVVNVNGEPLTQTVTQLTFDNEQVVLHMADGTTTSVDMADVTIVFTVIDAMKALEGEAKEMPVQFFDLEGRQLKQAPLKGAFMMRQGNKVIKIMK